MPGDRAPFRKTEQSEEQANASYHSKHDLREMYTRDNVERRRAGSHTLRKHLSVAQDKLFIAKALKVRDEYQVANNDDVVLVLVQQWIADGKQAEIDPKLVEAAKKTVIAKRAGVSA